MSANAERAFDLSAAGGCELDPIVVDLDGTLVRTDTLVEQFVCALFSQPLNTIKCAITLRHGRAQFKHSLAELRSIEHVNLPRREPLVAYLQTQRAKGRSLHLVSAANNALVQNYGNAMGFFDSMQGSSAKHNLKGSAKRVYLQARFPEGFVYAGDSKADLAVWPAATGIILAGASPDTARKAKALDIPIEKEFETGRTPVAAWLSGCRMHQWSKNLLLFVPWLMSANVHSADALLSCLAGFLLMGIIASSTYLINDAADIEHDRRHPTKKLRPLACGSLPLGATLMVAIGALLTSLLMAIWLNTTFAIVAGTYVALTLGYSFKLKTIPVLDVTVLAILFSLRLLMGMALTNVTPAIWLLTFSGFFFFSLSLVKRFVEISESRVPRDTFIHGRGYKPVDGPLIMNLGVSSSVASILIIIQYLMMEAFPSNLYANAEILWLTPFLITLWLGRVWLLATRGELDEDPVAFAVHDRTSLGLGLALVVSVALARFINF